MINYTLSMRTANSNAFEINQAKARIAAAQASNQPADPQDEALVATEVKKAYAQAQYNDVMGIDAFAKHIATHGCVYSRGDVTAIITMAVDCLREQLLAGQKVQLGDLGNFFVTLNSKGAESAKTFNAKNNITAVNVNWEPGREFKSLLADAEFNLVATRSAQAAVIKALKAGETTVDLSASTSDDAAGTSTTETPAGGGSQTPSGGTTDSGSTSQTGGSTPSGGGSTPSGGNSGDEGDGFSA